MEILLENVRSFCGQHFIPLKPLTLLVGENSTGKSTFLAMLAHVTQKGFPFLRPSFNVPPFDLGTYDSIATFKGGRYGRAHSFSIGFVDGGESRVQKTMATYVSSMGQPQLSTLVVSGKWGEVHLELDAVSLSGKARVTALQRGQREFGVDLKQFLSTRAEIPLVLVVQLLGLQSGEKIDEQLINEVVKSLSGILPAFALAPVRTKPRRTYDEISDEFKPEGDHIPVLLARIWQHEGDSQKGRLGEALKDFGLSSSLYKRIDVKRLGKRPSDPFQILVTTAGPPANLPDVGYGVSQSLPIVVQSVLAEKHKLVLLQQPEVHLHPRSQAALGSFFCRLVSKEQKHFVVETHSDYLLDRVRIEVAHGTLPPEDVLILFFEKKEIETRVHQIKLDSAGNITGAPSSYRSFFLHEEASLMSRKEK